jgi:hypothetical protein
LRLALLHRRQFNTRRAGLGAAVCHSRQPWRRRRGCPEEQLPQHTRRNRALGPSAPGGMKICSTARAAEDLRGESPRRPVKARPHPPTRFKRMERSYCCSSHSLPGIRLHQPCQERNGSDLE